MVPSNADAWWQSVLGPAALLTGKQVQIARDAAGGVTRPEI
jgi:hypothetical protein